MTINFNTEPYYDDFSESKKFYKILYRPSYAVQARELTQMQSILQNQISRMGNNIFEEGAMVIPGQISIDTKISYVKLESSYNNVLSDELLADYVGKTIVNSSNLKATVIHYVRSSGTDPATLYVRYLNSQETDNTTKVFADGEVLQDIDVNSVLAPVQTYTSDATGTGSIAEIETGVYFTKGHFVLVEHQRIILDKYSNTPTYRIGLFAKESVVIPEDDESLLDNAQASYNYAAPGAHRYYIDLILAKLTIDDEEDTDFVELARTKNGQVLRQTTTTDYSILEQTLARRTYDESGNYTVKNFDIDVREYRDNDRGQWVTGTVYLNGDVITNNGVTYVALNDGISGSVAPVHSTGTSFDGAGNTGIEWSQEQYPYYNRGINKPDSSETLNTQHQNSAKLSIGLQPGKAYVLGYEIEKISTEYVEVEKSRAEAKVEAAVVPTPVGSFCLVTNVNNLPPLESFGTITLYDRVSSSVGVPTGNVVGTARVKGFEYGAPAGGGGAIGTQTAIYKLFLFDVKMNQDKSFDRNVKGFYYAGASAALSFTADVDSSTSNGTSVKTRLIGSVSANNSTTISGNGTSFETDLVAGDYIYIGETLRRVVSVSSQNEITIDSAITVTNVTIDLVTTTINEKNDSVVYPIQNYAVKTVRNSNNLNQTLYQVTELLSNPAGVADGNGQCTLSVSTDSGTMVSAADNDNYIVMCNATGAIVNPISITPNASSVSFLLPGSYATQSFKVICTILKTGDLLTEKSKTLEKNEQIVLTDKAAAQNSIIMLNKADGYRLVSVKMDTGTFDDPTGIYSIDITERYEFDSGQRPSHYDVARIVLNNSFVPPSAPIKITFDYFTHAPGDYFTVNSYTDVPYAGIPIFGGLPLRDCIDFRPRISEDGSGFTATGSVMSLMPKRGYDLTTYYTHYLPKITKIALDATGKFIAIDGPSTLVPPPPPDPTLSMVLYSLLMEPYTFGTSSNNVIITKNNNKRYTMRDIGNLETRIDDLEYYTSLSLLEQQTESIEITDAYGDNRFKNGFIVDNFSGHNTGDVSNPDYMCSIDYDNSLVRPFFRMNNINLIEKQSDQATRIGTYNYQTYGDVITLPVKSHQVLVNQPYASRLENINPFAIFTFLGDVRINPSSDEWFEVDRRPDLVFDVEGNYTTIATLAEKAGVLGTVWNAWQNQWSGESTVSRGFFTTGSNWANNRALGQGALYLSAAEFNRRFGKGSGGGPARQVVTQVTATEVGQSRTGIKKTIAAKIDRQIVADRVLSSVAIPYIRSRNILIQIKKLKPKTKFYPYFDGSDISSYCTPASKIIYTPNGATSADQYDTHELFDDWTNVGGDAVEEARRIDGDTQPCLNRGDVITGTTSGATAVVVGKEWDTEEGYYALWVQNIKGTFIEDETITGSVSGKQGIINTVTIKQAGDDIITDYTGSVQLLFNIPNTEQIRFRCGTKELVLLDIEDINGQFTSRARANYYASGILETKQRTVNAVRNAEIVEEVVSENRVIVHTTDRVVSDTGWYDPLAQTFMVNSGSSGGAFISKIDVFFATKDTTMPVTLEIREVVNGYPGKRVLPFSRVTMKPEEVKISSTTVLLDGQQIPSYDTPTTFEFPSPVYVEENTEYCFILSSDSNNYKVWISNMGDQIPGTSRTISEQPYAGVLFKSQNASTWTPNDMQDMKFTIYRVEFDTSVVADVEFINDVIPHKTLEADPFEVKEGITTVRVWHRDHNMPAGSYVTLSNALSVCGIPTSELNKTHLISNVDFDSYTITVTTTPTNSGYGGGTGVRATENAQFDSIYPIVAMQTFSDTYVDFGIKGVSGKSPDDAIRTAYVKESVFTPISANENNVFNAPKMICSEINETNKLNGSKSLTMNIRMITTNNCLSPIIDTHRLSVTAIRNKVDSPTQGSTNIGGLDDNILVDNSANVTISGNRVTTSDSNTKLQFSSATIGKYITISGATSGSSTLLVVNTDFDGEWIEFESAPAACVGNITLTQKELFVEDNATGSSSTYSKYVTKPIRLSNLSSLLKIKFDAAIPAEAEVQVWYRVLGAGSVGFIEATPYTRIIEDSLIRKSDNNTFYEMSYSVDELDAFDTVQVKLAMKSTNTSTPPLIKNLRIIGCA